VPFVTVPEHKQLKEEFDRLFKKLRPYSNQQVGQCAFCVRLLACEQPLCSGSWAHALEFVTQCRHTKKRASQSNTRRLC